MAEDDESYDIAKHFHQSIEFIKRYISTTNVLVHCYAGMSRSASVVIAYLIQEHKMTLSLALSSVTRQRPCVDPNDGFMKQLRDFE